MDVVHMLYEQVRKFFLRGYKMNISIFYIQRKNCNIRKDGSILRYSDEKGGDGYGESV